MSYYHNSSYRRYCEYRANRQQYKVDQIAAPIVMLIFIGVITKIWWLLVGLLAIVIIRKICKRAKAMNVIKIDSDDAECLGINQKKNDNEKSVCREEGKNMELKSTDAGYVNKNNQKNLGKTNKPGTDNNQWFYQMECQECGNKYHANGTDVWLRKCPECQGGRP